MGMRPFSRVFSGLLIPSVIRAARAFSRNRYVRIVVNLLVLAFCAAYLARNFPTILADLRGVRLHAGWLALATLLVWAVNAAGGYAWLLLLRSAAPEIDGLRGMRAHFSASVVRYVPGYIWQFVGKAYLSTGLGVPLRVVNLLIGWELVELIGLGAAVALLFAPSARVPAWNLPAAALWGFSICGALLLVGILSAPWWGQPFLRTFLPKGAAIRPRFVFLSGFIIAGSWLLHGLGLWLTSAAFGVFPEGALPFLAFSFSLSLVSGILFLPVPNGLGVREGIMVFLLAHIMPQPVALLVAAVSRLELVSGEFVLLGIAALFHRMRGETGEKLLPKEE